MRCCKWKLWAFVIVGSVVTISVVTLERLWQNVAATLYQDNYELVDRIRPTKPSKSLGDGSDGLLWFVHVTDIHMSIFRDQERITEFQKLCVWLQNHVRPPVVVASGDLTDAKTSDHLGSTQWRQEWQFYRDTIKNCFIQSDHASEWFDIRGNHDTFDVIDDEHENNFYRRYSIQGINNKRSYFKQVQFHNRSYGFVGIDATLVPGPKRPFNFFGALNRSDYKEVESLILKAKSETDHHFVFGHYPTSCILSPYPGLRHLLADAEAYLCGHLHTLGGLVPEMYMWQKEGFFELELGDWKDNRRFRVLALDQGQISFSDNTFSSTKETCVIVVSNPMDVRFAVEDYNIQVTKESTHLRLLVFADKEIQRVTVTIDDEKVFNCVQPEASKPLYVSEWSPKDFDDEKLHRLVVDVVTVTKEKFTKTMDFSLARKSKIGNEVSISNDFSFISRLVLVSDLMTLTQICFGLAMGCMILSLILLRLRHKLIVAGVLPRCRRPSTGAFKIQSLVHNFDRRFTILSATNQIFVPLLLAPFYLVFGPWAFGFFLENSFGILFAWGFYVHGTLLHADTTSFYGLFFMAPYLYLFTLGLSFVIDRRFHEVHDHPNSNEDIKNTCLSKIWFLILMLFQILHLIDNYLCYGFVACLGVCGVSRLVFFYLLWVKANNLQKEHFVESKKIWETKVRSNR